MERQHVLTRCLSLIAALVAASAPGRAQCQNWNPDFGFPGMGHIVRGLTVFDDGAGPALYAGGDFKTAGGVSASHIAKWDGTSWSDLHSEMNNTVRAMAAFDDGSGSALYVGGWFTTAGGKGAHFIAKWDGADWSALGSGMNNAVRALTVFGPGAVRRWRIHGCRRRERELRCEVGWHELVRAWQRHERRGDGPGGIQ